MANFTIKRTRFSGEYWDKIDLYNRASLSTKAKEKFVLTNGPPYANGNIHMGTALNKNT